MRIKGTGNCTKCRHIYCQSRDRGIACNYYSRRKEDYIEHSRNNRSSDTSSNRYSSDNAVGQGSAD